MRKNIIMIFCICLMCILLVGCKDWKNDFTVTKLSTDMDNLSSLQLSEEGKYIIPNKYTIKNNTNETLKNIVIIFEIDPLPEKVKYEFVPRFDTLDANETKEFEFTYDEVENKEKKTLAIVKSCRIKKIKYEK